MAKSALCFFLFVAVLLRNEVVAFEPNVEVTLSSGDGQSVVNGLDLDKVRRSEMFVFALSASRLNELLFGGITVALDPGNEEIRIRSVNPEHPPLTSTSSKYTVV
jgi:hypothetical protein